jgi:hypothetical protein
MKTSCSACLKFLLANSKVYRTETDLDVTSFNEGLIGAPVEERDPSYVVTNVSIDNLGPLTTNPKSVYVYGSMDDPVEWFFRSVTKESAERYLQRSLFIIPLAPSDLATSARYPSFLWLQVILPQLVLT